MFGCECVFILHGCAVLLSLDYFSSHELKTKISSSLHEPYLVSHQTPI